MLTPSVDIISPLLLTLVLTLLGRPIYSLECSATVTGSTDQSTITWLDPMNNPVPSAQPIMGSTTTYTNTAMVSSFGRDQEFIHVQPLSAQHLHSSLTVRGSQPETARIGIGENILYRHTHANIYNRV